MEEDYRKHLKAPIREDRKPLQDLLPLRQPLRILIDPCDLCNFRCHFCFQSKMDFQGGSMNEQIFARVLGQLRDFEEPINVVHLFGLGEPLLNKKVPDYVRLLKESKVARETAITTNGSLLTEDISRRLVDAGLDRLSVSLNGVDDASFQKNVGTHVSFEQIYKQIQYFYKIRGACHLHVKINGESFDEAQRVRFVSLFEDWADSIHIDHIVNVWPGLKITSRKGRMYDGEASAGEMSDDGRRIVCPQMFYELLIHSDGSVSPCCVDYGYKTENLGNVYESDLQEIWNGSRLKSLRVQELRGWEDSSYRFCRECSYPACGSTVELTSCRDALLKKYGDENERYD